MQKSPKETNEASLDLSEMLCQTYKNVSPPVWQHIWPNTFMFCLHFGWPKRAYLFLESVLNTQGDRTWATDARCCSSHAQGCRLRCDLWGQQAGWLDKAHDTLIVRRHWEQGCIYYGATETQSGLRMSSATVEFGNVDILLGFIHWPEEATLSAS